MTPKNSGLAETLWIFTVCKSTYLGDPEYKGLKVMARFKVCCLHAHTHTQKPKTKCPDLQNLGHSNLKHLIYGNWQIQARPLYKRV